MAKRNEIDPKKKKEIEDLIDELKENAPEITKAEIEELESLLDEVLAMEDIPLWKRIGRGIGLFSFHYALMYVISSLTFGLFFFELAIENKLWIFLISGIISLILTLFQDIPRNPFRDHFISINLMIFIIIVLGIYIVDRDIYSVFQDPIVWVFYLVTVVILYYLMDSFLMRRILRR